MASIRKHRGKWQVQVRRKGTRPVTKSFMQHKDAEAWARQTEIEIDRNSLPEDPRHLNRHTLGELVVRYRDTVTPRKRAAKVETAVLNAFLRHPICSKKLNELGQGDFARYRDERLREVKPRSLQRMLSPIQNLFEIARSEWGLPIRENPIGKLRIIAECNRRERRLGEGELEVIVNAATKTQNPAILPVIRFAIGTGMRRSEILASRWEHIDWDQRCLRIPLAKNGHCRTIPLSRETLALLHDWRRAREELNKKNSVDLPAESHVFPISANALRLSWERLLKRARVKGLHFHDLRHEAISRFFELGLTVPEVAHISGHRDGRMLFRYAHARNQRILEQLDRAGEANCKSIVPSTP